MPLFDDKALKQIEAAVTEVEQSTAAEIVVVSVGSSDDYDDVRALFAFLLALASAAIAHVLLPDLPTTALLWLEGLVAVVAFFVAQAPPLLRLLLPKSRAAESVERRAREEFLEHRVFETRGRTGVLLLLSELEHQVVILGDKGIDQAVHAEGWERHVHTIVRAIHDDKPAEGVCAVIRELGTALAQHVPAPSDNFNELANAVRREER